MSRVLPILFNTDMVRAILDDRKTVTRRICKDGDDYAVPDMSFYDADKRTYAVHRYANKEHTEKLSLVERTCPICPEDVLYVRETWSLEPCWDCGMDTEEHNCCDESARKIFNHDKGEYGCYVYRASFDDNVYPSAGVWRPSIHMPKEAARIWLRVTDVRVKRLQDMWASDVSKEGLLFTRPYTAKEMILEFSKLWDSTIKKSDLDMYGWDANPWVWVIEFERCEKPKE